MNAAVHPASHACPLCGRDVPSFSPTCSTCGAPQRPDHAAVQRCADMLVSESFRMRVQRTKPATEINECEIPF